VLHALDQTRDLLPFPLRGLDTDNGSEVLTYPLLEYGARAEITFTRGRAYRKNDQCYVEQKNGSVVRQMVGYDRFEGDLAYHQLAELYRALRLYVNVFQPALKLVLKRREGSQVYRRYDAAQTPVQRLRAADVLDDPSRARLVALYEALDPVQVVRQLQHLQTALWRHAVVLPPATPEPTVSFSLPPTSAASAVEAPCPMGHPRRRRAPRPDRHRAPSVHPDSPRPDPFAGEADTSDAWLAAQPEQPIFPLLPHEPRPASLPRATDPTRSLNVRSSICIACGASDTVVRGERGPLTAYCAVCRTQRKRDQARQRMVLLRTRRRAGTEAGR